MATRRLLRFLVEQYVPQSNEAAATELAARLEHAADEMRNDGTLIQWAYAVTLPEEENLMCFIDADTIEHVLHACRRAGIDAAHVQQVTTLT